MSREAAGASFVTPDYHPTQTWFSMHPEVRKESVEHCHDLVMCLLERSGGGGTRPVPMVKLSSGLKSTMSSWLLLTNLGQSASILVLW